MENPKEKLIEVDGYEFLMYLEWETDTFNGVDFKRIVDINVHRWATYDGSDILTLNIPTNILGKAIKQAFETELE